MPNTATYIPGTCNLDKRGARWRRIAGILVAVAGLLLLIFMEVFGFPPLFRYLEVVVFTGVALLSLREAKNKFCLINALSGIEQTGGSREAIASQENIGKDMRRAAREFGIVALIAVVVGLIGLISF